MASKTFNVSDENIAKAIRAMTGERYYKFTNDGIEVYTFQRNKIIFEAYKAIKNFRKEHNIQKQK